MDLKSNDFCIFYSAQVNDPEKMQQYIQAMASREKENQEKLAAMWMYGGPSVRKMTAPNRQIVLIPANAGGSTTMLTSVPPGAMMLPPPPPQGAGLLPPPYHGTMTVPYIRPGSVIYAPASVGYRTQRSCKSSADCGSHNRRRRAAHLLRTAGAHPQGRGDAVATAAAGQRRQRCKSEADIVDGQAFQYTGLDRTIADNFLARQELSHAGSHIDYSSSSASETYAARQQAPSRASSKTKIICRDVVM